MTVLDSVFGKKSLNSRLEAAEAYIDGRMMARIAKLGSPGHRDAALNTFRDHGKDNMAIGIEAITSNQPGKVIQETRWERLKREALERQVAANKASRRRWG